MRTDYGDFVVEPLTPQFGAEVVGFDLAAVDEAVAKSVHDAWMDWKVLFFRDQDVTPTEHIDFARHFGELEIHPFLPNDGNPQVVVLDTTLDAPARASFWHTDVSFRECPPMGSILRGRIIPEAGGDTCWIDMERVYDDLADETKELLQGRTATHTLRRTFGRLMDPDEQARQLEQYPDQHHPVIRTHPVTGRKCLYLNGPFVECIDDVDPDQSTQLLRRLFGVVMYRRLENQIRFRWRPGSFAMWDNRCTQHYAIDDYGDRHRRVERVTLAGDKPF